MKKIFTLLFATCMAVTAVMQAQTTYTGGVFILNEDWFGHNASSINFYSYDTGEMSYRVYQAANPGLTLGNTTQYAAMDKNNIYFCSKQNYGDTGGRFMVADAKTLVNKYSTKELGGTDTRAFLPVSENKGYIGTNDGLFVFDIANLTLGSKVAGTSKQIGDMVLCGGKALATVQGVGYYVIDITTDKIEKTVALTSINTLFTVNGDAYASASGQFIKINPTSFELEPAISVPKSTVSPWFAWRNATPAVDNANEVLYYAQGDFKNIICKYDIKSGEFTENFITFDEGQVMYGNAVSFDPEHNYILAMTFKTYGVQDYWFTIYNTDGEKVKQVKLDDNYWFPAMFVFAQKGESSAVSSVEAEKQVAAVQYFNLQGQQSAEPFHGVNIVKTVYTDGTSTTAKVMK